VQVTKSFNINWHEIVVTVVQVDHTNSWIVARLHALLPDGSIEENIPYEKRFYEAEDAAFAAGVARAVLYFGLA
jgi:hypothetical protein